MNLVLITFVQVDLFNFDIEEGVGFSPISPRSRLASYSTLAARGRDIEAAPVALSNIKSPCIRQDSYALAGKILWV